MNVLIVGNGAREHAIAWKLRQSRGVGELFIAPGNAGTAALGANIACSATDLDGLVRAAREHKAGLTVVGPETPLAAGIVDRFRTEDLPVFGPTKAAARLEYSKAFAKELMQRHGIPTAKTRVFTNPDEAKRYVASASVPLVVKVDGLAAGKGVTVCTTREQATEAIAEAMETKAFGAAGERVLVEECLVGREVSVFAFTDGRHLSPLVAACDYKRLLDGDAGPNTGGMGSYSPPEFWDERLASQAMDLVMRPTVSAMAHEGNPYTGVLYAGLMLTTDGLKVLEFNCRLGDPETQVLLPRLQTDLLELLLATVSGRLDQCAVRWTAEACVGVVLASGGYPGEYRRGVRIQGLESVPESAVVFHAGTKPGSGGAPVTDGGRVMTVCALGASLAEARKKAYEGVSLIQFDDMYFRRDIAAVAAGGPRTSRRMDESPRFVENKAQGVPGPDRTRCA